MKRTSEDISKLPVVLVIGAGFGGLSTAVRMIKNGGSHLFRVIVVNAGDHFTIGGLWQFVWNDRLTLDQIMFDLNEAILPGIEMRLNAVVESWEPAEKTVFLQDGTSLSYEYVVLACGVVANPRSIPGFEDHVNICALGDLDRQRDEMNYFVEKARKATTKDKVTFVMAISRCPYKCPVAPFELTFLMEEKVRKEGLQDRCRFVMTFPTDWPMPKATKPKFDEVLKARNIEFLSDYEVEKIEDSVVYYEHEDPIKGDVIWTTYPIQAPDFVLAAIPQSIENGFVTVDDPIIQKVTGMGHTYVIGDCSIVEANELPVPKAGEFAWKAGHSVADHIVGAKSVYSDRTGRCIAELGCGTGIVVMNDFSEFFCRGGDHIVSTLDLDKPVEEKIDWVNSYLIQVFGEKMNLSLDDLATGA